MKDPERWGSIWRLCLYIYICVCVCVCMCVCVCVIIMDMLRYIQVDNEIIISHKYIYILYKECKRMILGNIVYKGI